MIIVLTSAMVRAPTEITFLELMTLLLILVVVMTFNNIKYTVPSTSDAGLIPTRRNLVG